MLTSQARPSYVPPSGGIAELHRDATVGGERTRRDEPTGFSVLRESLRHRRPSWWLSYAIMVVVMFVVLVVRPDGINPLLIGLGCVAATIVSAVLGSSSTR